MLILIWVFYHRYRLEATRKIQVAMVSVMWYYEFTNSLGEEAYST